MVSSFIN